MRPRSEWISRDDESLRIISHSQWERAQRRMHPKDDARLKAGGRPKYLLSGLLRCDKCGAHYIMRDKRAYACSSFLNGAACSNGIHVRRDRVESVLLDPIRNDLLSPERVQRMAKEMQRSYLEAARATQARAAEAPRELEDLAARIERLRERLRRGDPDMTGDEIEAAIDRAEAKRRELQNQQPAAKQSAKILTMLPRAAEAYRRQIAQGLDGDEREALKARVLLRELFGGEVRLVPLEGGGLDARWNLHAAALLRAAGTNGSGGLISLPATTVRLSLAP
jgi:hypothetical protein